MEREAVEPCGSQIARRFRWLEAAAQPPPPSPSEPDEDNRPLDLLARIVDNMTASNTDLKDMLIESGCTAHVAGALPAEKQAAASGSVPAVNCGAPSTWNELSALLCPGAPPASNAKELLVAAQSEEWQREALQRQLDPPIGCEDLLALDDELLPDELPCLIAASGEVFTLPPSELPAAVLFDNKSPGGGLAG